MSVPKRPTRNPIQRKITISSVHFGTIRNMNKSQEEIDGKKEIDQIDHIIDPNRALKDVLFGPCMSIEDSIKNAISKHKELEEFMSSTKTSPIAKVAEIFKLCHFTDQDVWEGEPQVFPIINHFSDELKKTLRFNETPIQVHLPTSVDSFEGIEYKVYQVDKSWKISKIVRIICKKFNISDSSKFHLSSMRNYYFDHELSLSDYGLGSLFRSWQLKIITDEEKMKIDEDLKKKKKDSTKKSSSSLSEREKRNNERKMKILERKEKLQSKKKSSNQNDDEKKIGSDKASLSKSHDKLQINEIKVTKSKSSSSKDDDDDISSKKSESSKKIKVKDQKQSKESSSSSTRKRSQSVQKTSDQPRERSLSNSSLKNSSEDDNTIIEKNKKKQSSSSSTNEDESSSSKKKKTTSNEDESSSSSIKKKKSSSNNDSSITSSSGSSSSSSSKSKSKSSKSKSRKSSRRSMNSSTTGTTASTTSSTSSSKISSIKKKQSSTSVNDQKTSKDDIIETSSNSSLNVKEESLSSNQKKTLPILFIFENYDLFEDTKVKRINILPSMTVKKVISSVLERYGLYSRLNEFALVSSRGKVLHPLSSLESYGLGLFYNKWELVIIKRSSEEIMNLESLPFSNKFNWIKSKDIQPGLQLSEAKKIILSLDSKLLSYEDSISSLNEKETTIKTLKREIKILKESEEKLKKQLKSFDNGNETSQTTLSDEYDEFKKRIAYLEEEIESKNEINNKLKDELANERSQRDYLIEKITSSHKSEILKLSEYSSLMYDKNEELVTELEELRGELFDIRQRMKSLEREKEESRSIIIERDNEIELLRKSFEEYKQSSIKKQEDLNRQLKNAHDHIESLRKSMSDQNNDKMNSNNENDPNSSSLPSSSAPIPPPPPPPPPPPSITATTSLTPSTSQQQSSSLSTTKTWSDIVGGKSILSEIEAARQVLKKTEQSNTDGLNKVSERNNLLKEIQLFSKNALKKVVIPKEKPKVMDDLTAALNKRFIAMTDLMDTIEDLSDSDSESDSWDNNNKNDSDDDDDRNSVLDEYDSDSDSDSDSSSSEESL